MHKTPKTIFAIEYKGEYAGNISLMPCGDLYRKSEKCGFVKEAVFKKSIFKNNTLYDEIRYAKFND
ncbi:MAG: GNAT family protein [Bacteroidales bacterium]|nr:GNAT family protein [Bacteroidales bacterium]